MEPDGVEASNPFALGHDIIGQQRGTTWHYFGTDGLGSNRFMMNSAGALTYSALYDPYGQVLSAVGTGNTNLGFTGEHTDPTGLQYLRARYYDPHTATFLSRDPALGVYPTLSGSWNGYTYAHGNPILYADPSGRCIGPLFAVCVAAAKFGGAVFAGATAIDAGTQVIGNLHQGMSFGSAIHAVDGWGSVRRGAEWGVGATVGRLTGGYFAPGLAKGLITARRAAVISGGVDAAVSFAWELGVNRENFGRSVFNTIAGSVFGEVAGVGVGIARSGARLAGDHAIPLLPAGARTIRRSDAEADVDLRQRRTWSANEVERHPVKEIYFTQKYYSPRGKGYTVAGNIELLRDNPDVDLPPIEVFVKIPSMDEAGTIRHSYLGYEGNPRNLLDYTVYTVDNRRLVAYIEAGRETIPVRWLRKREDILRDHGFKFSTTTFGAEIVNSRTGVVTGF